MEWRETAEAWNNKTKKVVARRGFLPLRRSLPQPKKKKKKKKKKKQQKAVLEG